MLTRLFAGMVCLALLFAASSAWAANVAGLVTDATGAAVPGATVVLRELATGRERTMTTGVDGKYAFDTSETGTFLLLVARQGFSEAARTVVIAQPDQTIALAVQLAIGVLNTEVSVTAARSEREIRTIPLHVETLTGPGVVQTNPLSTGDALASVANITPVGNGPFGVRPRLRGLDSTRMLVLVDGERLNTARQATDRTGAEVGLVSTATPSSAWKSSTAPDAALRIRRAGGDDQYHHERTVLPDTRRYLYGMTASTARTSMGEGAP